MKHVLGIDLGTAFSAVATINEFGKPVVLKNSEGNTMTPSIVAFESDGSIVVGDEAQAIQRLGEANTASFFKRSMGDDNFAVEFNGKHYSATDLSALVLRKLKAGAEEVLGETVSQAVITVPAYFNNLQRNATVQAGRDAGLEVLRVINEPTAAAIAFGIHKSDTKQTILVYDLGGGTFDVTLLEISAETIAVLATDGDHQLGGKDWDDRIVMFIADKFQDEFGGNPLDDMVTFHDLLIASETAKRTLTRTQKAVISVVHEGQKGKYEITRQEFESISVDLKRRTIELCESVLSEKGLQWKDLDGVLLVGGSTRMPMIEETVAKRSGKPVIRSINVDEAVAIGAAIQAAIDIETDDPQYALATKSTTYQLAGRKTIQDVTGQSLGMIAENADRSKYVNSIIIPRNTGIPSCEVRPYQFRTSATRENTLEVYVTQGESENPHECSFLGKYIVAGIQHETTRRAVLEVAYRYDRSGIVEVTGTQRSTGKALSVHKEPLPDDMNWLNYAPKDLDVVVCETKHVTVILAIDTSGSMYGRPMAEAQKAATEFVNKVDLTHFSVGIMAVADRTVMLCEPMQNSAKIRKAIHQLPNCKAGGGNSAQPFTTVLKNFSNTDGTKFMVVLADGIWDNQPHAVKEAKKCHAANIGIVALGFGSADRKFLHDIASCDENAVFTDLGNISESFSTIAQVLTNGQTQLQIKH